MSLVYLKNQKIAEKISGQKGLDSVKTIGKRPYLPILILLEALLLNLTFEINNPLVAIATPAAIHKHAFEWRPIKQNAQQFFRGDALEFINKIEANLEPAPREFRGKGLYSSQKLFSEMVHLIRPLLVSQNTAKVKLFFRTIADGGWIMGWNSSRSYSGPTVGSIELEIGLNKEYKVIFQNWSAKGAEKTQIISFSYATGVRALPIYKENDIFVFTNCNTRKIRNMTWGDRQGPQTPTIFVIKKAFRVEEIATGHWPYESGEDTGFIRLKKVRGDYLGTWRTKPLARFGGYNKVFWLCQPKLVFNTGTYEIEDSNKDTWINNDMSGRQGMSWVIGSPATTEQ